MIEINLYDFKPLFQSMRRNNISIEQYYVTYNNIKFDIIFDISNTPFELLLGAIQHNWGCVLKMERGFSVTMPDSVFYELCKILNLKPGKESLTSFKFLKFIASKAPAKSRCALVDPSHLIPFRKSNLKSSDEPDKVYFIGWNNHIKDKRTARNFDKTEKLLGKVVADYCRRNNISSMWSANPGDAKPVYPPF